MPGVDKCHEQVTRALQKEGWITRTNAFFTTEVRDVFIDVEAFKQRNGASQHILLAEVKCFHQQSAHEIYTSIGQYLIYRTLLNYIENAAPLYLAVPEAIYATMFDEIVRLTIKNSHIKMLIVNLDEERIVQWIE